jgi:RHS repeat-associated protein
MYRDVESGLLYAVRRYFNPRDGRFVTEDPLSRWFDGNNLGNGYAWVGDQYRNSWDPLGLASPDSHAYFTERAMQASENGPYSSEMIETAVQANVNVDNNQDPSYSWLHAQYNDEESHQETEDKYNKAQTDLMNAAILAALEAAMADRNGDHELADELRRRAMWYLGIMMHMRQDLAYHGWVDMSKEHSGRLCRTALNWLEFWTHWKGKWHDITDIFGTEQQKRDAMKYTQDIIREFENALIAATDKATGAAALAGFKQ